MKRCLVVAVVVTFSTAFGGRLPEGVEDTQPGDARPAPPPIARKRMEPPPGFSATLFAGEPDVVQPIAFAIDDRGRLWVVENFSYPNWKKKSGDDRVVIFEDTDHDGRFDKRKRFWSGSNLTGIQLGFGGVWLCATPNLLYIPDRNRDDRPDGPPQTVLTGWNDEKVAHNVFNGLTWGPDGWLYGCHGIQAESRVGKPGTPKEERTRLNCAIWRYHPTKETFEVVAHGTTNSWGLDFNRYGAGFFTNNVVGHLWHLIPGAHYERMHGTDYNPHLYGLLSACSDHLHYAGDTWSKATGRPEDKRRGGGHSHAGAMIYLGDDWPDRYRGSIFMNNTHGHRVNRDVLERRGSGYVARHRDDFLLSRSKWYKGVELKEGPDGGVYILDWNDAGECHDNDGVLRSSGRIYKVTYGRTRPARTDLRRLSDGRLVALQTHRNVWFGRHARRILQERAARGRSLDKARDRLRELVDEAGKVTHRLRALWALHRTGGVGEDRLMSLLQSDVSHLRAWAIRIELEDKKASARLLDRFATMAKSDPSPLVRLHLAAGMQRLPTSKRWAIAEGLATHGEDADDPNIPLMIWYGIEPAVPQDRRRALSLAEATEIPLLRRFIARRLAESGKK